MGNKTCKPPKYTEEYCNAQTVKSVEIIHKTTSETQTNTPVPCMIMTQHNETQTDTTDTTHTSISTQTDLSQVEKIVQTYESTLLQDPVTLYEGDEDFCIGELVTINDFFGIVESSTTFRYLFDSTIHNQKQFTLQKMSPRIYKPNYNKYYSLNAPYKTIKEQVDIFKKKINGTDYELLVFAMMLSMKKIICENVYTSTWNVSFTYRIVNIKIHWNVIANKIKNEFEQSENLFVVSYKWYSPECSDLRTLSFEIKTKNGKNLILQEYVA